MNEQKIYDLIKAEFERQYEKQKQEWLSSLEYTREFIEWEPEKAKRVFGAKTYIEVS